MVSQISLWLFALSPVFFVCMVVELGYLLLHQKIQVYSWRDSLCNVSLFVLREGIDKLTWIFVLPLYAWIYQHYRVFTLPIDWPEFVELFLIQDLIYYVFHRNAHRVRWFWAVHSVHHSSTRFNFSTAFRQSMLFPATGIWLYLLPLAWLGFPSELVLGTALLNLTYQFFIHTQLIPKLGRLEYVLNTPSIHRVHHAINPCYINHNFGGVLCIWDRIFGTFMAESDAISCEYGSVKPVNSFNPLRVVFVEWYEMFADARKMQTWLERIIFLFGSPKAAKAVLQRYPASLKNDSSTGNVA